MKKSLEWPARYAEAKARIEAATTDLERFTFLPTLAKAAFEKALANMQALAEGAQKANAEAYEIVSARIKESIAELKDLAGKVGRG